MDKREYINLAIEKTKERYDKKKLKASITTILVISAVIYICWLRGDFGKTLDYFTGIAEALIMGGLSYLLATIILLPNLVISEREKEDINRLKRELDRLESENLDV